MKTIFAALLIFGSVAVISFSSPNAANAQAGLVACAGGGLLNAAPAGAAAAATAGFAVPTFDAANLAANSATAQSVGALEAKECVGDGIVFTLAKAVISAMTQSLVAWINSGFDGNPAFVDDLGAFLGYVDTQAFEDFLGSDAVAFLCSPWKFDVQVALELGFAQPKVPQCSLGDVVGNIDEFLAGDFSQGGWDGWVELTTRNNPYRDYLTAASEADVRIAAARAENIKLLEFGRGFLSFEQCETRSGGAAAGSARAAQDVGVENCKIVTPGAVIESQLENVLGSGVRQLELADELDEIVSALMAQMLNQTITGGLGALNDAFDSGPSGDAYNPNYSNLRLQPRTATPIPTGTSPASSNPSTSPDGQACPQGYVEIADRDGLTVDCENAEGGRFPPRAVNNDPGP